MLRQKTEMRRVATGNVAMYALEADKGAPAGSIRRVLICTPPSPIVHMQIDAEPDDIALGRYFEWPALPPSSTLPAIHLTPDQTLVIVAEQMVAKVLVVVEYLAPRHHGHGVVQ